MSGIATREADIKICRRHVDLVNGRKASKHAAKLFKVRVDGKAHHEEPKRARAASAVPVRPELAGGEDTVMPAMGQLGSIVHREAKRQLVAVRPVVAGKTHNRLASGGGSRKPLCLEGVLQVVHKSLDDTTAEGAVELAGGEQSRKLNNSVLTCTGKHRRRHCHRR